MWWLMCKSCMVKRRQQLLISMVELVIYMDLKSQHTTVKMTGICFVIKWNQDNVRTSSTFIVKLQLTKDGVSLHSLFLGKSWSVWHILTKQHFAIHPCKSILSNWPGISCTPGPVMLAWIHTGSLAEPFQKPLSCFGETIHLLIWRCASGFYVKRGNF